MTSFPAWHAGKVHTLEGNRTGSPIYPVFPAFLFLPAVEPMVFYDSSSSCVVLTSVLTLSRVLLAAGSPTCKMQRKGEEYEAWLRFFDSPYWTGSL